MKLTKTVFKKWVGWIDKIRIDLTNLLNHEQIHDGFIEIVNANLKHVEANNGRYFCRFVRSCYGIQATVGIRRHIKANKDSISLVNLLEQVKICAPQMTYQFYLKIFPIRKTHLRWIWQEGTFKLLSNDGKSVSRTIINKDIVELKRLARKAEILADKAYAHLDRKGTKIKVTFQDLSKILDLYNKIACKYICFFTGGSYDTLKPTIQDYWQKIFTVPFETRKFESSDNFELNRF